MNIKLRLGKYIHIIIVSLEYCESYELEDKKEGVEMRYVCITDGKFQPSASGGSHGKVTL